MLTYTIEHTRGPSLLVRKTLHVEGRVDFRSRERLKAILFDALSSSDYLILNVEKVEESDSTFPALICSVRRTAKLLGKRLTIRGKTRGALQSQHEHAIPPRNKECAHAADNHYYLWERRMGGTAELPAALKSSPAHKKHGRER